MEDKRLQGIDLHKRSEEIATRLDCYVKDNYQELVDQFVESFMKYCNQIVSMQQQGTKGAIAYIHFSILRTNILLKKHVIRIDAYDETWYLDSVECSGSYEVEKIYAYLEEYCDVVEEYREKSIGKVSLVQAQKRIFDESKIYLFFVAELIRVGMKKVIQTDLYQKVNRASCFVVCIGGYRDRFDILYKEDITIKDSKEVKNYLQSKQQTIFSHAIYKKLDLSSGNYEDIEFQYSSFEGCDFSKSSWNNSRLLFSDLKSAVLKDTKMERMKIFDTDFTNAILENVSFNGAKLKYLSFVGAKLVRVDFSKALVAEEINFRGASLVDCKLPKRG